MTLKELADYDGREGRRAYIAVNDKIYDVTDSPRWKDGLHPPNHYAGQDLTEELSQAPHVRAVVERFPVVGSLDQETAANNTNGGGKITIGIIAAAAIIALIAFLAL